MLFLQKFLGLNFMKPKIKKIRLFEVMGTLVGLGAGYLYYRQIGCSSGGCPITSNPYLSMLWGGIMGYLIVGIIPIPHKDSPQS